MADAGEAARGRRRREEDDDLGRAHLAEREGEDARAGWRGENEAEWAGPKEKRNGPKELGFGPKPILSSKYIF